MCAYVRWNENHTRSMLTSCQTETNGSLQRLWEDERRSEGGDCNPDSRAGHTVLVFVERHFGEAVKIVPSTDVGLATVFQAVIANKTRLRAEHNRLVEELEQ